MRFHEPPLSFDFIRYLRKRRLNRLHRWHRWFAWRWVKVAIHPCKLEYGHFIWLSWVMRRGTLHYYDNGQTCWTWSYMALDV